VAHKATSSDGYVRIPTSALRTVQLRHFVSEIDPTIGIVAGAAADTTITGITEWVGVWNEMTVSVGWDWGVLQGVVVLLNPNEFRTNILLIGADGRPESPAIARIHLLDWIESLPWRQDAISDLLSGDAGLRR
jgi:hypothetical protein